MDGKIEGHKKLYEEQLVKEIMVSTALCVQELIQEDAEITEDALCLFLEENYRDIIDDTLSDRAEGDDQGDGWEEK